MKSERLSFCCVPKTILLTTLQFPSRKEEEEEKKLEKEEVERGGEEEEEKGGGRRRKLWTSASLLSPIQYQTCAGFTTFCCVLIASYVSSDSSILLSPVEFATAFNLVPL